MSVDLESSHPPPEVRAREPIGDELCRGAQLAMKRAEAAGWSCTASYARGAGIDPQGCSTKVVDSVVIRLTDGSWRVAAAWVDGKFSLAYLWGPGVPVCPITATQLRRLLAAMSKKGQ